MRQSGLLPVRCCGEEKDDSMAAAATKAGSGRGSKAPLTMPKGGARSRQELPQHDVTAAAASIDWLRFPAKYCHVFAGMKIIRRDCGIGALCGMTDLPHPRVIAVPGISNIVRAIA
ncbi:MAG: hypothetical protein FWD68_06830 [Alphaproteobacteria bacterium]|nr:hypothetical protein [Alphaproteobacteria bacterium]